jgi:O-antigen/teichoic acid export membrane protein
MSLKEETIHASKWNIGLSLIGQTLQFIFSVVMARLLVPGDFGVFGMAFVFIVFLQLFSQFGMGSALIQKTNLREEDLSSVFWLNLATGIILCVFFAASTPFIAIFFNQPILKKMGYLLSVGFIISAFSIVQGTLLAREMCFKKLSIAWLVSLFFSGISQIFMALAGFGVWSLVWGYIILGATNAILLWCNSEWRPKFVFCWIVFGRYSALVLTSLPLW